MRECRSKATATRQNHRRTTQKISRPDGRHDFSKSGRGLTERNYARVPERSDGNPAKPPPDYQKN
ncbi:MAG: hypothetical protein IJW35_07570, partial [Lentisphaeria bacterium]|nr:hypothetical protein [Lentisphaeria bacterium]